MSFEDTKGKLLGHVGCPLHGGSDSLALYEKQDKPIDGMCYAGCGYVSPYVLKSEGITDGGSEMLIDFVLKSKGPFVMTDEIRERVKSILDLPSKGWAERRIPTFVSEFYGVKSGVDDNGNLTRRYYPSYEENELVGWHVRDVKAKERKNAGEKGLQPFFPIGKVRTNCKLFGEHCFTGGGRDIIIAAGQEDVMAIFTAMNIEKVDGKWALKKYVTPVVSTHLGEGGVSHIQSRFQYVSSFQRITIMYDSDDAGARAAQSVARLFRPGQVRIAKFRRKDACEHSKHGEFQEIVSAFFKAEEYSSAGIVGSSQTLSFLQERATFIKIPLPGFAEELSSMFNGGFALGEITTIAAASSVGKTTITNEFNYHWIFNAPYTVGIISLESDVGELTENLMSIHCNIKLANMPDEEKRVLYFEDKFIKKHAELTTLSDGSDRYHILDHQGAVTDGSLMQKVEYLVKGLGCKIVILDPLTLALSGKQNDGMDIFMSDLLRFVKREKVAHINVVHIRKNTTGSQANSRGAEISEEDIKGSGSIFQVSMNNILLMRDKVNENNIVKNTTRVVVSKNRRCGNTGPAGFWFYDNKTSRLMKGSDPESVIDNEVLREFEILGAFNNTNPDDFNDKDDWEVITPNE